ncbi:hypothetical protein OJAV_G00217320 [Oryzias javanicus]|uniref:Ig-like domain-containing protein n=1 Tax=Oryzias javanicus TaxID=123683 RepID=A0A437C4S2_ORYJA|nr:hypothetical protein OJAV_G00217320 [Oryzias javanicus]
MASPVKTFGFLCVWLCCRAAAVTFHQTSSLIVKENSEVQIDCSHDDSALILMLWYRRSADAAMTLIGYGYETGQNYEGLLEEEFTLTRRSTVEGVLTVREARQNHTAVYFCAASTRWCGLMPLPHQNLLRVSLCSAAAEAAGCSQPSSLVFSSGFHMKQTP